jgi:hypothetical protein
MVRRGWIERNIRRGLPLGRVATIFTSYTFAREEPAELIVNIEIVSNDFDEPYFIGRLRRFSTSPSLDSGIGGDTFSLLFPFQGTSGMAPSLSLHQSINLCNVVTLALLLRLKSVYISVCAFPGRPLPYRVHQSHK